LLCTLRDTANVHLSPRRIWEVPGAVEGFAKGQGIVATPFETE
jgi:hypothetical protein